MIEDVFKPQAEVQDTIISCRAVSTLEDDDKDDDINLPLLIGDERRLNQCLINLVKNALKFTFKGQVNVRACWSYQLSQLTVQVKDTGKGIDAADMSHLFKRYGKLNRTAQLNKEGLGLGLTIVQEIVEAGNGRITVESDGINRGTCFKFTMILAEAPEEDQIEYENS